MNETRRTRRSARSAFRAAWVPIALLMSFAPVGAESGSGREMWSVTRLTHRAREGMLVDAPHGDVGVLFLDRHGDLRLAARGEIRRIGRNVAQYNWASRGVGVFTKTITKEYSALWAALADEQFLISDRAYHFALTGDGSVGFLGGRDEHRSAFFVWHPGLAREWENTPLRRRRPIIDDVQELRAGLAGYYCQTFRPAQLHLFADGTLVTIGERLTYLADGPSGLVLCEDRRGNRSLHDPARRTSYAVTANDRLVTDAAPVLAGLKVVTIERSGELVELVDGALRTIARRGSHGMLAFFAFNDRGRYVPRVETFVVLDRDAPVAFRDDRRRLFVRTADSNVLVARNVDSFYVDLRDGKIIFCARSRLYIRYQGRVHDVTSAGNAFAPLVGARLLFVDERRNLYLYAGGETTTLLRDETVDAASLDVASGNFPVARRAFQGYMYDGLESAGLARGCDVALARTVEGGLYLLRRETPSDP